MHIPTHLGVIIHFTEFATTAVKRPVASLLFALEERLWQGVRAAFSKGKGHWGKSHAHTLPRFQEDTANSTMHINIKKPIPL